jgi:hypothetical protein
LGTSPVGAENTALSRKARHVVLFASYVLSCEVSSAEREWIALVKIFLV